MNLLKKRVAIMLAFLMVFTVVGTMVPSEMSTVEAASKWNLTCNGYSTPSSIYVEAGAKQAYLGELCEADNGMYYYGDLTGVKGVSYKSNNTSVASIGADGLLTAKRAGNAKVTISYMRTSVTVQLHVVKKGGLTKYRKPAEVYVYNEKTQSGSYKKLTHTKLEKAANDIIKVYGKGLDDKNMFDMLRIKTKYDQEYSVFSSSARKFEYGKDSYVSCYWANPTLTHADKCISKLYGLAATYTGTSTRSAYCFRVASVKGSGSTVNITLKKKVSKRQLLSLEVYDSKNGVSEKKGYLNYVYVTDCKTKESVYGEATFVANSNKVTLKLDKKLKRGHKYVISEQWAQFKTPKKAYTFTAK